MYKFNDDNLNVIVEKDKKNKILIIILISIIIIGSLAAYIFFVPDNIFTKLFNDENKTQIDKKSNNKKDVLTRDDVEDLTRYIPQLNINSTGSNKLDAYENKETTFDSVSSEALLSNIIYNISLDADFVENYSLDDIKSYSLKLYNREITDFKNELEIDNCFSVKLDSNLYVPDGSDGPSYREIYDVSNFEENESDLVVYTDSYNLVNIGVRGCDFCVYPEDENESLEYSKKIAYTLYSDFGKKIELKKYSIEDVCKDDGYGIALNDKYKEDAKNLNSIIKYKHLFKKNTETQEYYWYSSEPINSTN